MIGYEAAGYVADFLQTPRSANKKNSRELATTNQLRLAGSMKETHTKAVA